VRDRLSETTARILANGRADRSGWRKDQLGDAYEGDLPPDPEPPAPDAYRFAALASDAFFSGEFKLKWLVKRLLIAGQPAVLGGPRKSLKTSIAMDLAISLASGTQFLGYFDVDQPRRVAFISGESGEAVLQDCGRRICAVRGVDPHGLDVHWNFRLPQLANVLDRRELSDGLKRIEAAVVIIDPRYLALLAGVDAGGMEAGNLFHMGPLLASTARACLDAGATPVLSHHARKTLTSNEPMELDDLAFAGIQEFARQWLLINRRAAFDPETGASKLWLSAGGSAGQSGLWAVDVDEGTLRDDFRGRQWEVAVRTAGEERDGVSSAVEDSKARKRAEQVKADGTAVLKALDALAPAGASGVRELRAAANFSGDRMTRAILGLVAEGVAQKVPVVVAIGVGHKAKRTVEGLQRTAGDPAGTNGTNGTERLSLGPVPMVPTNGTAPPF
jgi:hypothetical protein